MMAASVAIISQQYRVTAVKVSTVDSSRSNTSKVAPRIKPAEDSTLVWIPTVFTPNWDNLNDLFKPVVMNADSFHFEIYSREGQFIQALKAGESWKGSGVSSTYIWIAKWIDRKGVRHREGGILIELN